MAEESYLENDTPVLGQNYVCLSFVSPEDMIESKEGFKVSKFLQSVCKDKDMDFKKISDIVTNKENIITFSYNAKQTITEEASIEKMFEGFNKAINFIDG